MSTILKFFLKLSGVYCSRIAGTREVSYKLVVLLTIICRSLVMKPEDGFSSLLRFQNLLRFCW